MPRSASLVRAFLGLPVAAALLAPPAHAVVRNWANVAGGSAAVTTNWSPNGLPGAADNLIFPISTSGAVTIPVASVPGVISHDYRSGAVVQLSADGIHTLSGSFGAGLLSTGAVILTGGTIRPASVSAGLSAGIYGRITMLSGSGIPAPAPPRLEQTDPNQSSTYASDGLARLEILGGSAHTLAGNAIFANTATSRCTLVVAGRNTAWLTNSSFTTTGATKTVQLGSLGQFHATVDNGGYVRIAGDTWLGRGAGSVGTLRVGAATTTFHPSVHFDRKLRIGDTGFNVSQGGTATLEVAKGPVTIGELCTLGDPDGGGTATLRVHDGGTFVAAGGFTRYSNSVLEHRGGVIHLTGGPVAHPQAWLVSSQVGSPELRLSYAGTMGSTWPVQVARAGQGKMRITQSGTHLGTSLDLVVGDSLLSNGTFEADSGGSFEAAQQVVIGRQGTGTLTVRGGARVAGDVIALGEQIQSTGTGLITGANSRLDFGSSLTLGGTPIAIGGIGTLEVDSGAVVQGFGADPHVYVKDFNGTLSVRNGAEVRARVISIGNFSYLDNGILDADVVGLGGFSAALIGNGRIRGTLVTAGVLAPAPSDSVLGTLVVDSTVTFGTEGALYVRLSTAGGPPNDSLVCRQHANLSGTLNLLPTDFVANPGDSFTVMTFASRTGTFDQVWLDYGPMNGEFEIVYEPTRVVVVVPGAVDVAPSHPAPRALRFGPAGGRELAFTLEIPARADVRVDLFDVTGRRLACLHDGPLDAGVHRLEPREAGAAGIFFARATVRRGGAVETRTARAVSFR